jgi:hypothetical protein
MRVSNPGPIVFLVGLFCAGCAHYQDNPPLSELAPQAGYRYNVVREEARPDNPFVLFSGPYSQDNKPSSLRWCPGRAADRRCPVFERGFTLNKFVYDSRSAAAGRSVDL